MLEALAAQFKPVMKDRGFAINSLVEAEWNPQFAGRNWNAGEVVEIVLRRPDGSFAPWKFILMVMAHECAHIKEMNHSSAFQKVNIQLRKHVDELRSRGYYGDGFWSSGHSLRYGDIEKPLEADEMPEFICGGANKKTSRKRRQGPSKARGQPVKLGKTGRQTAVTKKAGGRVNRLGAFKGEGHVMDGSPESSTFRQVLLHLLNFGWMCDRKRANAVKAVEARALAAERRLQQAQRVKEEFESKEKIKAEIKDEEEAGEPVSSADEHGEGGQEDDEEEDWIERERQEPLRLTKEEQEWLNKEMQGFWEDEDLVVQTGGGSSTVAGGGSKKSAEHESGQANAGNTNGETNGKIEGKMKNNSRVQGNLRASSSSSCKPKGRDNAEVIVLDNSSDGHD
ncbi:hypothetical protein OIV83_002828 [Microbotryomycetes sp. JL201]|nr:hypothetical protein OIV83_002828 [Microbotryomycetes sp. JL201]